MSLANANYHVTTTKSKIQGVLISPRCFLMDLYRQLSNPGLGNHDLFFVNTIFFFSRISYNRSNTICGLLSLASLLNIMRLIFTLLCISVFCSLLLPCSVCCKSIPQYFIYQLKDIWVVSIFLQL